MILFDSARLCACAFVTAQPWFRGEPQIADMCLLQCSRLVYSLSVIHQFQPEGRGLPGDEDYARPPRDTDVDMPPSGDELSEMYKATLRVRMC